MVKYPLVHKLSIFIDVVFNERFKSLLFSIITALMSYLRYIDV